VAGDASGCPPPDFYETTVATKLFCYVDESGQDTRGRLFIVSVVVSSQEREELREVCAEFEQETGKGRLKWVDAEPRRRLAYLQQALSSPLMKPQS
jgi:hypothetical protein